MNKKHRMGLVSVFLMVVTLFSFSIIAGTDPEPPTNITIVTSSTRTPNQAQNISAIAGNVTQINIYAYTQTRTWQGYYGNITGTITLDDSQGHTVYDWETTNPSGQIYASTTQVNFAAGNVECYNFSRTGSGYLNLSAYESSLGLTPTSADGINETFNETNNFDSFYVGVTYINRTCPVVYLYNASNQSSPNTYQEVLLYDLAANNTVFTSIIRPGGILGFNNEMWDFQMIVAEKGHGGDTQTTPYFFYISLE